MGVAESWPHIRASRLGKGVVVDAQVVLALRRPDNPHHGRVLTTLGTLAEQRLPLIVSSFSLFTAVHEIEVLAGPAAALLCWREAAEVFNIVTPTGEDFIAAERFLARGGPEIGLDQALTGVLAQRLGCSVYGLTPVYHLLHLPVIVD